MENAETVAFCYLRGRWLLDSGSIAIDLWLSCDVRCLSKQRATVSHT